MLLIQLILFSSYQTRPPSHSKLFFSSILSGTLFPWLAVLSHSRDVVSLDFSSITFGYSVCHFNFFLPEKLVALQGSTVDPVLCSWLASFPMVSAEPTPWFLDSGLQPTPLSQAPDLEHPAVHLHWDGLMHLKLTCPKWNSPFSPPCWFHLPTTGPSFWVARPEERYNPARTLILRNLTTTGTLDPFSFRLISEQSLCLILFF